MYKVFSDSYLVDEGGGQQLSEHFELEERRQRCLRKRNQVYDLEIAWWLQIQSEPYVYHRKIRLDDVADLSPELMNLFHRLCMTLGEDDNEAERMCIHLRADEVLGAEAMTTSSILVRTNDRQ